MKEQENKNIEELADKMMHEMSTVSPSLDFTNTIMEQVEALQKEKITVYKPLIPKHMWFLFGFLLLVVTSYLFFNTSSTETSLLSALDFRKLTNNAFTQSLFKFSLPKTVLYAILSLGLMICIQVPLLKHYFDKRLSV
ncbi:hypothetical protein Q4512_11780 [Oceanihabitans sp. 2_MG-2023]|uniref:hypothetical protein n=1 Tax=Oceanihabitans sp. 2_MG-2023 TaxID=3062661 RepID=UPI0026E25C67|nr:hypothetical protein [Oceanihabitans sp. 2_MG-2023]MDO6597596.1 hypothetical protein [Oceanihabitans sp. 2_MG-2023]